MHSINDLITAISTAQGNTNGSWDNSPLIIVDSEGNIRPIEDVRFRNLSGVTNGPLIQINIADEL